MILVPPDHLTDIVRRKVLIIILSQNFGGDRDEWNLFHGQQPVAIAQIEHIWMRRIGEADEVPPQRFYQRNIALKRLVRHRRAERRMVFVPENSLERDDVAVHTQPAFLPREIPEAHVGIEFINNRNEPFRHPDQLAF